MDKQPTKEQVQKFWEWCGFQQQERKSQFPPQAYYSPSEERCYLPDLDLNNIFKWAVPRILSLYYISLFTVRGGEKPPLPIEHWDCNLSTYEHFYSASHNDPTLAIFWAIWEVIDKETK